MRLSAVFLLAVVALTGCGMLENSVRPVGTGTGRDDLKVSPCACVELEPDREREGWRNEMSREIQRIRKVAPA